MYEENKKKFKYSSCFISRSRSLRFFHKNLTFIMVQLNIIYTVSHVLKMCKMFRAASAVQLRTVFNSGPGYSISCTGDEVSLSNCTIETGQTCPYAAVLCPCEFHTFFDPAQQFYSMNHKPVIAQQASHTQLHNHSS